MERVFDDTVMITFDRIKASSYRLFKVTLDNKIVEYRLEELKYKKETDMYG